MFAPLLAARYQPKSFDNVTDQNAFDEEGVCSVAVPDFASGGTYVGHSGGWTQLSSVADVMRWTVHLVEDGRLTKTTSGKISREADVEKLKSEAEGH